MNDQPFSTEQQEYLKGFMSGVEARRGAAGLSLSPGGGTAEGDPNDLQRAAQDRTVAAGGKLSLEEDAKRKKNPLDRWDEMAALAAEGKYPKGTDVFLTKYHGLFYVSPAQDSFMCRLRIPGGILNTHQFRGVADIADDLGGGYADCTTRANLQIREIKAQHATEMVIRLSEIGLTARGSGADNVRNVTGSPTAGIDKQELIDTRPHARAIHFHILHHRELYGLPRKFNIAYDGGGRVPVLEDTNDIAWTAVRVTETGEVLYRLGLGGITGHSDFARSTGVLVHPADTVPVADAILRVFIANGDRTDRKKARLKYLLDRWGFPTFIDEVEKELGDKAALLVRMDESLLDPAPPQDRHGHVGVHEQKQPGLRYVGVVFPVGRMLTEKMRSLADVADRYGSGTIRLTVWQNLLISDIPAEKVDEAVAAIHALGLRTEASALRKGLVACTGNAGCKFAASNTKRHAHELVDWLDERVAVTSPINIHLTGCHNSCAQHLIADIGLLGAKVERGDDLIEGYDLHVGGGAGPEQAIGRLIRPKVAHDELQPVVLALLQAWQADGAARSFHDWSGAQDDASLLTVCEGAIA